MLATSGTYVYVAYFARVDSPVYSNLALLRSSDAGLTWETRRLLGDYGGNDIVARDSNVYVHYNYVENNRLKGGLMASHDWGETWNIINNNVVARSLNISMVVTSSGLHLVRDKRPTGREWEVMYLRSTDFGFTWSAQETLSVNDGMTSYGPDMAADDSGNLCVLWLDGKYGTIDGFHASVILRKSTDNGVTWGLEQLLTYTPTALFPRIAQNGSLVGVIWSEYIDYYTDRSVVRLSTNKGARWCDTVGVSFTGGDPAISVTNRHVHTVWSQSEIFYRRGEYTGPTSVIEERWKFPGSFSLEQNHPNPFNPETAIEFSIAEPGLVTLKIYDILGREVQTLVNESKTPGKYKVTWDARDIPSGVYLYRLTSGTHLEAKKLILLK